MQKAIEVYKNKYANKIMISGKGPNYEKNITLTEAEEYANIALENNIPEQDLILEKQAIKRFGNFEDIKNVIDFFISEKSDFITGQVIYLGGVHN